MTCAEFQDRLFDEDARAALLGRGPSPADLAAHATHCPTCRAAWAQEAATAKRLSRLLVAAPPPALRGDLYRAFHARTRLLSPWIDTETLSWAVAGGAIGAGLLGPLLAPSGPAQCAGFCVGMSFALVLSALQRGPTNWRAPWTLARATATRCLDRLAQLI